MGWEMRERLQGYISTSSEGRAAANGEREIYEQHRHVENSAHKRTVRQHRESKRLIFGGAEQGCHFRDLDEQPSSRCPPVR